MLVFRCHPGAVEYSSFGRLVRRSGRVGSWRSDCKRWKGIVVVCQRHAWTAQQGHATDLRPKRRRRLMAKDVRSPLIRVPRVAWSLLSGMGIAVVGAMPAVGQSILGRLLNLRGLYPAGLVYRLLD